MKTPLLAAGALMLGMQMPAHAQTDNPVAQIDALTALSANTPASAPPTPRASAPKASSRRPPTSTDW